MSYSATFRTRARYPKVYGRRTFAPHVSSPRPNTPGRVVGEVWRVRDWSSVMSWPALPYALPLFAGAVVSALLAVTAFRRRELQGNGANFWNLTKLIC